MHGDGRFADRDQLVLINMSLWIWYSAVFEIYVANITRMISYVLYIYVVFLVLTWFIVVYFGSNVVLRCAANASWRSCCVNRSVAPRVTRAPSYTSVDHWTPIATRCRSCSWPLACIRAGCVAGQRSVKKCWTFGIILTLSVIGIKDSKKDKFGINSLPVGYSSTDEQQQPCWWNGYCFQ